MLIDDFYHITELQKSGVTLRAQIELNSYHAIFKGHFPQQAIVPGVMQIQIIKELLEDDFKMALLIKEVIVAKYLRPVTPAEHRVLQIQIDHKITESGEYLINATVSNKETTFTKLKARLSESGMQGKVTTS